MAIMKKVMDTVRQFIKYFLFINILLSTSVISVSFAQQGAEQNSAVNNTDGNGQGEQVTLSPQQLFRESLKEGMIVGYFNQYWSPLENLDKYGYYRKLIKIEGENRFVVQDFFADTNIKQSDPVTINNLYELNRLGTLRSIDGPYITWYKDGQKKYQAFYKDRGTLDGVMQAWYEDGLLKLKGQYENNKKVGQWTEWHDNGRVKSRINYVDDVLDGPYEKWYENGQQQTIGNYKQGLLTGLWIVWDSKGNKISEGEYVADQRMGLWTYYSEGKKWAEGSYINNLQDDIWLYWNDDGTKDKQIIYQKGVKLREIPFTEDMK